MKRKGFTLVELLAVIAILAILVIIALPNIMELFNQAKQNSFENEVKQIYKTAQQEWMKDSMLETKNIVYSRCDDNCSNELNLSGRKEIDYYIEVNKAGNVTKLFATDGTYQYQYRGEGLKIEEIEYFEQVATLQNKDILSVTRTRAWKNGRDVTDGEGTNVGQDCLNNEVVNTIPSNARGLYKIIAEQAYLDNVKSTYVARCEGVDFNAISSDTNGKGVYELASTKDNAYPIYYYRGAVTNNNVKFGGFCWKAVRTTDTGGVKLIYNGEPDASGHCTNTTGTSTQIKTNAFNSSWNSPAYVGYMYGTKDGKSTGTTFTYTTKVLSTSDAGIKFGKSVTYSGGTYTLTNIMLVTDTNYNQPTSFNNNHYTCFSESETCTEVYYVYYINGSTYYYIPISGVDPSGRELIDVVKDIMFRNDKDSTAKIEIEKWYKDNMTSYTSKLEDTIFCNDRSISVTNGWSPTGSMAIQYIIFSGYTRTWSTHIPSLACERPNDRFTVSSSIGNGKLTYPVGLLTTDEIMLAGERGGSYNNTYYLYTNQTYWTGSPSTFHSDGAWNIYIFNSGLIYGDYVRNTVGLRPVVSLSKNANVTSGDGTANSPFVILVLDSFR